MEDSNIQMLFRINADRYEKVKNKKKLYKFFKQMGHITFEKADLQDNTKWFCAARDRGFMDAMLFHREGCRGVFDFDNFDKWRVSTRMIRVVFENDAGKEIVKIVPMAMDTPEKEMPDELKDEYGYSVVMWEDE